jgi:tRNA(fMet)-specific endonuclease VapC
VTTYLLDTNTCIEYLRRRNAGVLRRMQMHAPSELRLCSVVVAELYYGAFKSPRRADNLKLLGEFVPVFESVPFDNAAAERYGEIRARLESGGRIIGPYDLQIAAIALIHGLTLVTHNVEEMGRVPGLAIEDWQA